MTETSRTVDVGCGNTYTFQLQANNATATRTYIFRPGANTSITIRTFTFHAVRQYAKSYWSSTDLRDYLEISYGSTTLTYGNDDNNWGNSCHEIPGTGFFSTTTTYYHKNVTVPEITVPAGEEVTFTFHRSTDYTSGGNCTKANFSATLATSICCPTLTAPTDGEVVEASDSVTLTWEAMSGVTSYDVYVNNARVAQSVQNTSCQYSGLVDGTTYRWKVVPAGANAANYSHCSPYTFKACSGISCATNLQPADGTVLTDRLISWDAVECASSYEVFVTPTSVPVTQMYAKNTDNTYKYLVAEPTSTEYHLPILTEGEYRWVVRPKNSFAVAQGCETHTFKIQYQDADDFAVTPSTQGTEFYFSLMENGYQSNGGNVYTAVIAPKVNAEVTFHYYADPTQNQTYIVSAGATREVDLPATLVHHDGVGSQYNNRTVRVTSNNPISLYIANEARYSFDASIVLPTTALGTDYMIQTYENGNHTTGAVTPTSASPCFMVIAKDDNTPVRISGPETKINALRPTPSNVGTDATTGLKYFDITLNEGESYFLRTDWNSTSGSSVLDLSGVRVAVNPQSSEDDCKTIAVFNGNTLTRIPAPSGITNNMDHIFEQAYPITNWGTKFAVTSSMGFEAPGNGVSESEENEYIRITATEDNTEVKINGTVVDSDLDAGETYDYDLYRPDVSEDYPNGTSCYIETNKPVACYLYQRSGYNTSDYDGDPSMVWIAPIERGIEDITFSTFAADGINANNHFVNIVIPIEAISGGQAVMLKRPSGTEENIRSRFMTGTDYNYVEGSGNKYAYARLNISHGTYTLRSIGKGKMVIHTYGIGEVRGYAYAAGSEAVPYKSNFLVGDENGGIIDISTLQDPDFHFCSGAGAEYTFMINSNSPNVDSVKIDFDDGSPIKTIDLTKNQKSVTHSMPNPGPYEITAQVYSTIYNNALCQEEVIVETVRDYVFIFFNEAETIRDTVCYGTDYTFTRNYWVSDTDGNLEQRTYTETFQNVTEQRTATVTGYSEYGCEMNITFILDVYSEITAGTITPNTIECMSDGHNIGLSVVQLQNSVSATSNDPNAHYQWQKSTTESGPWVDITNQTGESYIVTENGYYRRAYIAACSTAYSNVLQAEASGTFNPGTPIDNTVRICSYETLPPTTLGVQPSNTEYDGEGNMVLIGGGDYRVLFQWQQSTDGGATWRDINGATSHNYTLPTSYTQSTSFRRLITEVGPCTINLSSGNYNVVVKPTFEYEKTIVKGCPGENNASVEFTITGGSGSYKVYYTETAGSTTVDYLATSLGNGKYIFRNLTNSGSASYAFTIEDEIHGCEKTETITIGAPTALSIGSATAVAGCQGATINIDIPAISGGTGEGTYRIEVESSVLNINEEVTADPYSATIPGGAAAGTHTVIYKVLDAAGCYKTSTQNVLTIYANPVLALSKTNISDCQNPNGTITATVTNAPNSSTSYTYTIDPGTSYAGQASYTFDHLSHNTYTVTVKDNQQCTAVGSVTIEDNLDLTIATSVTDMEDNSILTDGFNVICPKTEYKVNVTQVNGANTPVLDGETSQSLYQYSFDGGNTFSTDYSYTTISPNTCNNQNINVVVMEMSSHCKDEQNVQVIVQDLEDPVMAPTLTAIEKEVYFCTQYTFDIADYAKTILDATNDNCAAKADLQVTTSPSMQSIVLSVYNDDNSIKTTDVTFTVTDLCGNDSERKITITPKPWPNFKINGTATDGTDNNCYCHGDNIVLTAVVDNGTTNGVAIDETTYPGATYQWYKGTEAITDGDKYSGATTKELKISSAISTDDDPTNGDDGVYKLVITDPKGCKKEATITICVHPNIKFNLE
ncbi:MAG: IgGFc-binding protein [Bacteroidales bacterium]|nr:IgGFc-binding protein [Bacteroidales bacterium]